MVMALTVSGLSCSVRPMLRSFAGLSAGTLATYVYIEREQDHGAQKSWVVVGGDRGVRVFHRGARGGVGPEVHVIRSGRHVGWHPKPQRRRRVQGQVRR